MRTVRLVGPVEVFQLVIKLYVSVTFMLWHIGGVTGASEFKELITLERKS